MQRLDIQQTQQTQVQQQQQATISNQNNNNSFTVITTERKQVLPLEGQSIIEVPRPKIKGYIDELSQKTDSYHSFPTFFDDVIIQNGVVAQRLEDRAFMYIAKGNVNGVEGVYTIGINQQNIIFHRCFYNWSDFFKRF